MASSIEERHILIMETLARNQVVKVSRLSEIFGVSEVSIRRDLDQLERLGVLKRIHGGAVTLFLRKTGGFLFDNANTQHFYL